MRQWLQEHKEVSAFICDADDETDDDADDETDDGGDHDDCLIRFIVSHDSPVLSFHIRNFLIWPVPVEMKVKKVIC